MSTPVIERPGTPGGGRPRPQTRRTAAPPRIPAQRGPGDARRAQDQRRRSAARENTGRAKFVLVVMVLLAVGLIATLWLSTAAAADSYALQEARQRTGGLTEQSEALRKEVSVLESPASLAQRAAAQGMVPVSDPARLVVAPDGRVDVVGEPQAAVAAAPPPAPDAPQPAAPAAPQGTTSDPEADGGDAAAAAGARADAPAADAPQDGQQGPDGAAPEGAEREVPADTRAAGRD
ncbi:MULTISPECIES: septum formation initiator [unclassified Pseudonocardia]|uniref:septum formation initiator n=1 Tax=unclassified Pseudonocardia TaxID=2619320 RepID=UPI000AA4ECC9|nr:MULTISPECIES: septum formation initiator [unclassified Pseudonocardia]